ncbi:MAG: efflux RND transporter periplasmic adaptor subunit, partial [Sulfitobacter litoralis]|nr:efflux RND transporter periplasmic adaptor subunit [Sulfitobacter litoralis]
VTLADGSEYPLEGVVDFADPQVDPKSGTFGVRAEIANPDQILLPGQFTSVKFLLDLIVNATVVPRKALIIEKGGSFVYVMRTDSIAEKRFVQPGVEFENSVIIERGLSVGENVIIEGQHKIHPGDKVKPVEATEAVTEISSTKAN